MYGVHIDQVFHIKWRRQTASMNMSHVFCIWTYTINEKNSSPSNGRPFHLGQVSLPRKDRGHRLFAPLLGRLNTGLGDVHDQDEVPKNRGTWAACFRVTKLQNRDQ